MKRTNTLWTSLFLCFVLLNLGLVGPSLARNKPVIDPISGLSSDHMAPSASTRSTLTAVSNLWTKYSGNPVLDVGAPGSWDSNGVGTPSVLIRDANFLLWYAGNNGTTSSNRVGLATSPDGLTWDKSQNNPVLTVGATGTWDSGYVMAPHVIYHEGLYKMWYRGNSTNFAGENIGYATSTDGVTWVKYPGNPVLVTGSTGTWESNNIMSAYLIGLGSFL